jgi:hypothetical protein
MDNELSPSFTFACVRLRPRSFDSKTHPKILGSMSRCSVRTLVVGVALSLITAFAVYADTPRSGRTEFPLGVQPQLTVANDGRIWVVFGQAAAPDNASSHGNAHASSSRHAHGASSAPSSEARAVFLSRSDDGGLSFAPAIKIAELPGLMLGNRRGPRIAAFGDSLTVTMIANELLAIHSSDGGDTWSDPVTINDVATCAREGLHDLAVSPHGELFVTWLDLREGTMELWGATSADAGQTWSNDERIYRSPGETICQCCHPSVLSDRDGNLAVMWRNAIDGSRDMWIANRFRGTREFTGARKLGSGSWMIEGCPVDGGRIVALGDRNFGAVWQRAGEIFYSGSDGGEILVGKGKQPVATLKGDRLFVAWQQGSSLVSTDMRPNVREPMLRAENARQPVLVSLPDGAGVLLGYEQGPSDRPTIVIERL